MARRLRMDQVEFERVRPSALPSTPPPRQWSFEEESSVAQCHDDLSFVDQMELASKAAAKPRPWVCYLMVAV